MTELLIIKNAEAEKKLNFQVIYNETIKDRKLIQAEFEKSNYQTTIKPEPATLTSERTRMASRIRRKLKK